jgi:hypothetical protein
MTTISAALASVACTLLFLITGAVILGIVVLHKIERWLKSHKTVLEAGAVLGTLLGHVSTIATVFKKKSV